MPQLTGITTTKMLVTVALAVLILVSGCQGPFDLATALGIDMETMTISPDGIVVDTDTVVAFFSSSGEACDWSLTSGSGSINPETGVYTPSGDVEYVTVRATDRETGEFGQSTVRFQGGIDIEINVDLGPQTGSEAPGGLVPSGTDPGVSFTIENFGSETSTEDVNWKAWLSPVPDMTPGNFGDIYLAEGTISNPALDSGETVSTALGVWNAPEGEYNLIVTWTAIDDGNPGNDFVASSSPYTIVQVDYEIANLNYATTGVPGLSIENTTEFTISEINGANGSHDVSYSVFVSYDSILDGSDMLLTPAIDPTVAISAGGNAVIPLHGVYSWPDFGSEYYLIISIDADDDAVDSNNRAVMGPIIVPAVVIEDPDNGNNDYNDSYYDIGPPARDPGTSFHDLDIDLDSDNLRPDELIQIIGIMDPQGEYDTYGFTAGSGLKSFAVTAEWAPGADDIDLALWHLSGSVWDQSISALTAVDYEGVLSVNNLVEGEVYYVGVNFWLNGVGADPGGDPYTLTIRGLP